MNKLQELRELNIKVDNSYAIIVQLISNHKLYERWGLIINSNDGKWENYFINQPFLSMSNWVLSSKTVKNKSCL